MAHASPTVLRARPAVQSKYAITKAGGPSALSVQGMPTAPYQVIQGQPKAATALIAGTIFRSVLLGAGMYAVGVREPAKLASGALLASAGYSLFSLAHQGHAEYVRRTP